MLDMPIDFQETNVPNKTEIVNTKTSNLNYHLVFNKSSILAGIIKIPPKEDRNITYQDLPRTEEDEKKIEELITSIGIHGKLTLLLHHEKRLRKIGDEIRYLHPFKFLGFLFSRDDLKQHMFAIFDDYFKRTNFTKDLFQTLDVYDLKNKLTMYVDDFSNEVNIPANKIRPFVDNKDWLGLLKFLMNN
ncbi:MAG: hypothetical protein JXA94_06865 [Parachlamydiales bacterium]|nr:hypothetical protein [Parachlamydiales bacterium]